MDLNSKDLCRRWKILQEQLISLWAFHKRSPGANEFLTFLNEGFPISTMSLNIFTQICYFLLGLINREERDKIIKWPIINIQGQVRFRKGVSAIVKSLIEKYPQMNLKRLPESYLIDPSHNQKKILDFILKLSNLAVHLTVDDPHLLVMLTKNDMNANEIETAIMLIKRARIIEEKIIEENIFPIAKFENIRITSNQSQISCRNITNKCVALKQENLILTNRLKALKKNFMENGIIQKEEDYNVNYLKNVYAEKISEISQIKNELQIYSDLSKAVINSVKASGEPVFLSADDLGLEKGGNSLVNVTEETFDKLSVAFDCMKCKDALPEEKEEYLENLENVWNALLNERKVLQSFILKYNIQADGCNL